ncbi:uncharacterized protein LOC131023764 [Salvia miltiorrhiza]|uniref:uncharacterized protein LOC131023764 n=1 Tax=Salvia miltiorrhiza TaxID=226208 RepID=UPI0025AC974C|nr:uncharacterized protein LOC131023764 [Salvia miltiorrhiza]
MPKPDKKKRGRPRKDKPSTSQAPAQATSQAPAQATSQAPAQETSQAPNQATSQAPNQAPSTAQSSVTAATISREINFSKKGVGVYTNLATGNVYFQGRRITRGSTSQPPARGRGRGRPRRTIDVVTTQESVARAPGDGQV